MFLRYWHKVVLGLGLLLLSASPPLHATDCQLPWPRWQAYQKTLISPEGRVIDYSDPRHITTSEGQSYALFYALVDGDKALFHRLLQWTEKNLAQGDLANHLPAWLWGQQLNGDWGVLDSNSASDSDLWIAYVLLEAGRLWNERSYTLLGNLLAQRIEAQEAAKVGDLGSMLLPGRYGFEHEHYTLLNPSYLPPQVVTRIAHAQPTEFWQHLVRVTPSFLQRSAPLGIAPNWIRWGESGPLSEQSEHDSSSSYDAIRVYLWIGMLPDDFPAGPQLREHFQPILRYLDRPEGFPEHINSQAGTATGVGPSSFSFALLPLSTPAQSTHLYQQLEQSAFQADAYYSQSLSLFSEGWAQERFRFDEAGQLLLGTPSCSTHH